LTEEEISWTTKNKDKAKFPVGTEHVKVFDPYGVGYEGTIHIYKRPGEDLKSHVDFDVRPAGSLKIDPVSEWKHAGDPFRIENVLNSDLSPMTKTRMLQKLQEQL
jgi:hypothetical protein